MSDIIRDAVIRLRLEMAKGGLDSSALGDVTKNLEQQAAAGKKVEQQHQQNARAAKEYARTMADVPDDWGRLFKSRVDAKNFAYRQMGESGYDKLRSDPEHIAYLKRTENLRTHDPNAPFNPENFYNRSTESQDKLNESTEKFGQKSSYAYGRGLMGITEFGRGLALLASDGSESSQKLLKNIVAIQGGVDLVRGSLQMARLGPEIGAIAAAVAAASAAWMLHAQQVERNKKIISDLTEEYKKASQAESKWMFDRDKTNDKSRADSTNAQQTTEGLRSSQVDEFNAAGGRRVDRRQQAAANAAAAKKARAESEKLRSEASLYPESRFQAFVDSLPQEYVQYHDALIAKAKQREASAKEHGTTAIDYAEQGLSDTNRQMEIFGQRRQYGYSQLDESHRSQMGLLGGMPDGGKDMPERQARLAAARMLTGALQSTGLVGNVDYNDSIGAQSRILQGIQSGRGEQAYGNERFKLSQANSSETEQLKKAFDDLFQSLISLAREQQQEVNDLKRDLASAHTE